MERRLSELPEKYAKLYDRSTSKFFTPVDDRGLVNIDDLYELSLLTYREDVAALFSKPRDVHHVYRSEAEWYEFASNHNNLDAQTILRFRDGTPQKIYIPRPLHEHIERVTHKPEKPDIDVMRRRNAAWEIARRLLIRTRKLTKARNLYEENKYNVRRDIGPIDGITPVFAKRVKSEEELMEYAFWRSQLGKHLAEWKVAASQVEIIPVKDRIVETPWHKDARKLAKRVNRGAFVPQVPEHSSIAA